jgi:hypothetical protein
MIDTCENCSGVGGSTPGTFGQLVQKKESRLV